jgi:hypothetical protein
MTDAQAHKIRQWFLIIQYKYMWCGRLTISFLRRKEIGVTGIFPALATATCVCRHYLQLKGAKCKAPSPTEQVSHEEKVGECHTAK